MRKLFVGLFSLLVCLLMVTPIVAKEECMCHHNHDNEICICLDDCPFNTQWLGCDVDTGPCP